MDFECASTSTSDLRMSEVENNLSDKTTNEIVIKCEPDWFCSNDTEQEEHSIEINSVVVKSEYEFQSSFTRKEMNDSGENDVDDDDDDDDDEYADEIGQCSETSSNEHEEEEGEEEDDEEEDEEVDKLVSTKAAYIGKRKRKAMLMKAKRVHLDAYVIRPCPYCSIEFESYVEWKKHLNNLHDHKTREKTHFIHFDDGRVQCTDCNLFLNQNLDPVKTHSLSHLPHQNVYKCKICSQVRFQQRTIFEHVERHHFDVVGSLLSSASLKNCVVCPYCEKYVGIHQMISMHIQKEHSAIYEHKLWYACPVCGEEFSEESCRKNHLKNVHNFDTLKGMSMELIDEQDFNGRKKYRCLKCNKQIVGKHLTLHALLHQEHKIFKCRFCDYGHNIRWKVIKHSCEGLLNHIQTNPLVIATRRPSGQNTEALESSKSRVNNLLVCPKCGSSFEEQSLWEEHLRKEHKFNDLKALGFEKFNLDDGTTINRCTVCEKQFVKTHFHNLRVHAFMHMPYKLHKCKLCEKPLGTSATCLCHTEKGPVVLLVCPQCGIEYNGPGNWNRHLKQVHNLDKPSGLSFSKLCNSDNEVTSYKCSDCGHIIKESEKLYEKLMFEHAVKHMAYKCYKCSRCGESGESKDILKIHTKTCEMVLDRITAEEKANCNRIAKCQCHICGYLDDSERNIRKHLSNVHLLAIDHSFHSNHSFTWFCTECEFKYDREEKIMEHVLSVHLKTRPVQSKTNFICFICPLCSMKFQTKIEWESHLIKLHGINTDKSLNVEDIGGGFKCLECFRIFRKKSYRKLNHYIIHRPIKSFNCILCGVGFKSMTHAQKHVVLCARKQKANDNVKRIIFTEDAEDMDEVEGEPLQKKKKKIQKSKIQAAECEPGFDPLQIDETNVQSFSPTSMAVNTPKSHSWNKYCQYITYACPECNMQFATADEWHLHISSNHDFFLEKRLNMSVAEDGKRVCNECGIKICGGVLHAQRHKLTHMPYQAFICKLCLHRSKTNNVLIYHIERRHFSPGEFKCLVCQMVFKTSYECVEHAKRDHIEAELPDKVCRICIKQFSSVYSLRDHMKAHEINREVFECELCKRKYFSFFERKKHLKQAHPLEYVSMLERGELDMVVQRTQPVKKTKKCRKKKGVISDDEDYDETLLSSDKKKLSNLKPATKKTAKHKTRSEQLEEGANSLLKNEDSLHIMSEPVSDDELTEEIAQPIENSSSNLHGMTEVRVRIKRDPKVEEALLALLADEANVQSYSITTMALSSAKSSSWNKYCQYITYACPECNMQFATAQVWHLHISSNHDFFTEEGLNMALAEDGKRVCNECGITIDGSILHAQRHKLTHMPYQAFICKLCLHRSKTNNVLISHIERRHFSPGEFKCVVCQMIFETSYECVEHAKRDHTEAELPDKVCRICIKELSSVSGLREHMKTHEFNREVFECEICKRKYFSFCERKKHLKQAHPQEYVLMLEKGELEMIVQKTQPITKTKKHQKKKGVISDDEDYERTLSNSDKKNFSKTKPVRKNSAKLKTGARQLEQQANRILENVDNSLQVKSEPMSDDEVTQVIAQPNNKSSSNVDGMNEIRINGEPKVEEDILASERIFKNEPISGAHGTMSF